MSWKDNWNSENPMVRDELWDNWEGAVEENFDAELDYTELPEERREEFFADIYSFADSAAHALSVENYRKKSYIELFGHINDDDYIDFGRLLEDYPEVKVYE